MKILRAFLLAFVATVLSSCDGGLFAGGSSSTETGGKIHITGRVVDPQQAPVAGIVVTLARAGLSDTTDAAGTYSLAGKDTSKASGGIRDSVVYARAGQRIAAYGLTQLVAALPDVQIIQRNISGLLLPSPVPVGRVEVVLSGDGIPPESPVRADFFFSAPTREYSGFLYFPVPASLRNYAAFIQVYDTAGRLKGRSRDLPFNSLAGDITIPPFDPGNAVPKAFAGRDTALAAGTTFVLRGAAVDSFGGAIAKWEWNLGGAGFKASARGDTAITLPSAPIATYRCILRVTDNDGNVSAPDTLMILVTPIAAPAVALSPFAVSTTSRRPTWAWTSGGGGAGVFRYRQDNPDFSTGATITTALSFTPAADLGTGSRSLYVQERDSLGNWGPVGSSTVLILNPAAQTLGIAGDNGALLKTGDDGSTWTSMAAGAASFDYRALFFASTNRGWAVNYSGGIRKTTNGGTQWSTLSPLSAKLTAVHFIDGNTGWITGHDQGTVKAFRTTDGGDTWTSEPGQGVDSVNAVQLLNAGTGWVVAHKGRILKTTNGGISWIAKPSGTTQELRALQFLGTNTGWVVGAAGTVLKTTDGGESWAAKAAGTAGLNAVRFVDANTGWAVGAAGAIVKTTNGGETWTAQASGTGNGLYSVHFADANKGWAVGGAGTILKTTDGGASWTPQTSGTTQVLRSITPIP
jgi:photosystem II stability/assembly factor-like uncharacterized protein